MRFHRWVAYSVILNHTSHVGLFASEFSGMGDFFSFAQGAKLGSPYPDSKLPQKKEVTRWMAALKELEKIYTIALYYLIFLIVIDHFVQCINNSSIYSVYLHPSLLHKQIG